MADSQVLRGSSTTIRETFSVDGVATNLDAAALPAVVATYPDGSAGPTLTATKPAATTGVYQVVLPAEPEVTWLDLTWTGTVGGQPQTLRSRVEWIGAFLFSLSDLRAMRRGDGTPFTDTAAFPDSAIAARRTEVLDDFEARTGYSFVERFTREVHSGGGSSSLFVRRMRPGTLLSVSVDGGAQTVSGFDLEETGRLTWTGGTLLGTRPRNVVVCYVRGWERPPPAITSAALARAAMLLLPSVGSTVSQWTTPDGVTYSYDQAGQSFAGGGVRHYGVPAIDSVLNSPAYNAGGLAVA